MLWRQPLARAGLGGIAATADYVVLGDRDLEDFGDAFRCYDAKTGLPLWTVSYPAPGKLDYGNTPRATPLIHGDLAYLQGAFGDLYCVRLKTGEIQWIRNLRIDFGVDAKLIWGMCSSPLIADGKLIVNPGAELASLAALDPKTGDVIWETPGEPHAFGSFICARFGGVLQIVGYDRTTLGGWDVRTGRRLWKLVPPNSGDFNVPTPLAVGKRLLVTTENNATRLYDFTADGKIVPDPVAVNEDLAPDMSTPVAIGDRLFCVWGDLACLDLADGLKTRWTVADKALGTYGAIVASERCLLAFGNGGYLLMAEIQTKGAPALSKLRVLEQHDDTEQYSHPALVGDRLFFRGENVIMCIDLGEE